MFTVTVDRPRRMIEVRLEGMLDVSEIQQLRAAIGSALAANRFAPGRFLHLVDISDCPIQSQEVYAAIEAMGNEPALMPARRAAIAGASPARMQARRIVRSYPYALFDTREEALAWLFSSAPSEAASAAA